MNIDPTRLDLYQSRAGNERIGSWMSAALDDPKVCAEMKADVEAWFESWEGTK